MDDQMLEPTEPTNPSDSEMEKREEIKADVVNFSGQVTTINAQAVTIENGGAGAVKGDTVTINVKNGGVGAVMAQKADVSVQDGGVGAVLAQEVTVKGTRIAVAMAGNISGDAQIMFDMRAGLLAGIAAGLVMVGFKLITGRRR